MRISIREVAGAGVLAGAPNGRKLLAKLLERTAREPGQPEKVFLDFKGVEVATASYLREGVLRFRDAVRGRRSNFYPVVANANESVRDELSVLLEPHGDALLLCMLDADDRVSEPRVAGSLDPKQRVTLELVLERGETDAAELMRNHGEKEGVTQTAWNNRLTSLASLGLIYELSQGRAKRYRRLFLETEHGN